MIRKRPLSSVKNVVQLLRQRETNDTITYNLQQKLHVSEDFVSRLGLTKELEGHRGCVNCLEWNESGRILASGSHDLTVILWDPFIHKKIHTIKTGHHGNIFSVKFLPKSNDGVLVTGAADHHIHVHDVNLGEMIHVCSCHTGRVRRLATAPNLPFMYWSAAEDGTVMQFDMRMPHSCGREVNNVLVNLLNHMGHYAEAKCLAINPQRPELLAVGANDPYIRLYDRRMIKPITIKFPPDNMPQSAWERQNYLARQAGEGDLNDNLPQGCVQYYVAGHLPMKQDDHRKQDHIVAATYITFDAAGNELLVNLCGEQIYLFDINNKRSRPKTFNLNLDELKPCKEYCVSSKGYNNGISNNPKGFSATSNDVTQSTYERMSLSSSGSVSEPSKKSVLPIRVEALKLRANDAFDRQHFTLAIRLYNRAITFYSTDAILYDNRAAAYMKRNWDGDMYAAMRDCHTALHLDPSHMRAHFRLARCLYELQWIQEASDCLQVFRKKFPEHAQSHACKALAKDIQMTSNTKQEFDVESEFLDIGSNANELSEALEGHLPIQDSISMQEHGWQNMAYDYETRFCGHCNSTTDNKEANFFGRQGQYIVAGSDDGTFFIWDRHTTNIKQILRGDDSIVNCLQPHPSYCLLATSGVEPIVRLWSPRPEDGSKNDCEVMDLDDTASDNQEKINADPFELMIMNLGYRISSIVVDEIEGTNIVSSDLSASNCQTS